MQMRICVWVIVSLLLIPVGASAQNFSGDARKIGMGGIGYSDNIAMKIAGEERPYTSIVVPVGLIQLIQQRDRFNPDNDNFDAVLALESAANPLHYVFNRDPGGNRGRFTQDLRKGELSRDLNDYRGFVPTNRLTAEGLASPSFGKMFKVHQTADGAFQGFYAGVGPYLSAKSALQIDQGLIDVLASPTPVQIPNRTFTITNQSAGQLVMAVTGGYRAHFALPGRAAGEGIYVAADYHYLRGFRYETVDMSFRFNTDSTGLITLLPTSSPALIDYSESRSGRGLAVDLGIVAVVRGFEFGFGANGVGNRVDWRTLTGKRYTLQSLVEGGDFLEQRLPAGPSSLRVKLPVEYVGNGIYHRKSWTIATEIYKGFQGTSFHGGLEYRLARLELRAGGRYGLDQWHPSGGIGLNLTKRFSVDVGAFGTTTNIERELRPALALSLRLNATE